MPSHYYGREAGLELREDIETELSPGMMVSVERMPMKRESFGGAGGYREHDILVVTEGTAESIIGFPFGQEHKFVSADRSNNRYSSRREALPGETGPAAGAPDRSA